jgi:hypothetical protein
MSDFAITYALAAAVTILVLIIFSDWTHHHG